MRRFAANMLIGFGDLHPPHVFTRGVPASSRITSASVAPVTATGFPARKYVPENRSPSSSLDSDR